MANWGVDGIDIQPGPLKLECAACGRSAYLDNLKLCDQCREAWDVEMSEMVKSEESPASFDLRG